MVLRDLLLVGYTDSITNSLQRDPVIFLHKLIDISRKPFQTSWTFFLLASKTCGISGRDNKWRPRLSLLIHCIIPSYKASSTILCCSKLQCKWCHIGGARTTRCLLWLAGVLAVWNVLVVVSIVFIGRGTGCIDDFELDEKKLRRAFPVPTHSPMTLWA